MSLRVIIFSKDRPLQLHATIASMRARCRDSHNLEIVVLFVASDFSMRSRYTELENEFPVVGFVEQTFNNFEAPMFNSDLLDIVRGTEHVMFVCDDAIFVRDWSASECMQLLETSLSIGVSLRLGTNTTYCYTLDKDQAIPGNLLYGKSWYGENWTASEHDFGYPLELSSSIYRTKDLWGLLSGMYYRNPNELEAALNGNKAIFACTMPILLYPEKSIAFCAPLNMVQTTHQNRFSGRHDMSPTVLAERFDEGYRVDVGALKDFTPNACHQVIDLPMHQVEISVVIPCYNQGEFLHEAVASVQAQTFKRLEIIIVNDGSTDETLHVADALAYDDDRIRVIHQPNAGLAATRNIAVAAARGRFILPLDADDKLEPTFLSRVVEKLRIDASISIVHTDAKVFGVRDGVWVCNRPFCTAALIQQNGLPYCSLYRREIWEEIGGYNPNMTAGYEDWDFWLAAAEIGFRAARVAEPLFLYREKATSMLGKAREHHASLHARMRLNHPDLFYSAHLDQARAQLERSPLPSVHGA